MANKIIGGDFEIGIDLYNASISCPTAQPFDTYSSGRAALYNILKDIKKSFGGGKNTLLIPDYICSSVISIVLKSGFSVQIYELDDKLNPDFFDIENKIDINTVVLVVNYYGCIKTQPIIRRLRKIVPNITVILDNVQSPFTMQEESDADYVFTSLRKAFPVPDGAWVSRGMHKLSLYDKSSDFSLLKIAGCILKSIGIHGDDFDRIYLELLERGEREIDDDVMSDMSIFSKRIMNHIDINRIKLIRQRNARQVLKCLERLSIRPLVQIEDTDTPLFVPVSLPNRDKVRRALFSNNIFCPVHWPIDENIGYELAKGRELALTELSIIIDQRYNSKDIERMLNVIESNI